MACLLLGWLFGHLFVLSPMHEADLGAEEIVIHDKGVLVAVAFLTLGAVLTLVGPLVRDAVWPGPDQPRWPAYTFGLAIAGVAILTLNRVLAYLEGLGYQTTSPF